MINLHLLMGNDIATWRSRICRIGLFTPCQIHHIRQLHAHTKPGTNQGTTISLFTLLICVITVTLIYSAIYYETTNLHYVELDYATCNSFSHHSLFTTKNAFAGSSPPCKLLPSLLLLCVDIHPNPGPTIQELTQDQNLLNCLMLLKRSNSNLSTTSTIYKITSTTGRTTSSLKDLYLRPTIFTNNPHFHEQWRKNQLISGRKYLKLLTRERRKIIKTLEEQFAITKEHLRKNSSVICFNYYNEKLSSMARSLEVLLYNRRLHKNISTSLNQADHTNLPTSFTPQLNTPHNVTSNTPRRKRSRRNTLKHNLLTRLMHLLTLHL